MGEHGVEIQLPMRPETKASLERVARQHGITFDDLMTEFFNGLAFCIKRAHEHRGPASITLRGVFMEVDPTGRIRMGTSDSDAREI